MTEPKLRTSTKSAGAMTIGMGAMVLASEFFPALIGGLSSEATLVLGSLITTAVGWISARLSKTATKPGKL